MARTRYATPQTEAEQNALRDRFCKAYEMTWIKAPDNQRINTLLYKPKVSGDAVAYGEFRCRTNSHDTYPTYMLDRHTWGLMKLRFKTEGKPVVLVVGFSDGDYYIKITPELAQQVVNGIGGRHDRGDVKDVEPVVHIPIDSFKQVGAKAQAPPPQTQGTLWSQPSSKGS
jgi:hypothetical protein